MEPSTLLSDWKEPSQSTAVQRLFTHLKARRAWEEANPELAEAWGAALKEDHDRVVARELAAEVARAPSQLAKLGVPRPVLRALWMPEKTLALEAARDWWASGEALLLLCGGVGSGKTTAAAWCLLKRMEQEAANPKPSGGVPIEPGMFVTAPEFNGLSDYSPEARAWMERLSRCGLLVLDDLGTERMGDGELSCIQRLVGERHAADRRTVLTTNLSGEAFKKRYGERVADRIRESGIVKGSGKESLRKPAG